ncbi:hypothetical protein [Pseudoroseomonas cervicalis]|uniref:hypothetical protein n=1 Tax=Teichococcus cervicalis TaxID=204525 RepID=UPI0022F187D1|nr:hypothetical protein [Pseudoroseomonas cervicalis]WBV45453.1 hypothetical protein PFY06_21480 [Pseudoroseomonas cervicalis]
MPLRLAALSLMLLLLAGLGLAWRKEGQAAPAPGVAGTARAATLLQLAPAERAARLARLYQD